MLILKEQVDTIWIPNSLKTELYKNVGASGIFIDDNKNKFRRCVFYDSNIEKMVIVWLRWNKKYSAWFNLYYYAKINCNAREYKKRLEKSYLNNELTEVYQ